MNQQERSQPSFQYHLGEKYSSQTITSIKNERRHLFAVGTNKINIQNKVNHNPLFSLKIHIFEFLEAEQKVQECEIRDHPGSIYKLIPSQQNEQQLYAIYSEGQKHIFYYSFNIDLVKNQVSCFEIGDPNLKFNISFTNSIDSLIPSKQDPQLFICDHKSINIYDLIHQSFTTMAQLEEEGQYKLCDQDPYHKNLFTRINNSNNIHIIDQREKKVSYRIPNAHNLEILDLDFNPNKQYHFLTAGEDCLVKIWDLRKTQIAMKSIEDLQNSPLTAKFNKFHDQLISIGFDDGTILLYRATSVSSVPSMNYQVKDEDGNVKIYDEHDDSISQLAWSFASAWIFASVCVNSNVIINLVPQAEKYKILL